jgi:hypothetical protein
MWAGQDQVTPVALCPEIVASALRYGAEFVRVPVGRIIIACRVQALHAQLAWSNRDRSGFQLERDPVVLEIGHAAKLIASSGVNDHEAA